MAPAARAATTGTGGARGNWRRERNGGASGTAGSNGGASGHGQDRGARAARRGPAAGQAQGAGAPGGAPGTGGPRAPAGPAARARGCAVAGDLRSDRPLRSAGRLLGDEGDGGDRARSRRQQHRHVQGRGADGGHAAERRRRRSLQRFNRLPDHPLECRLLAADDAQADLGRVDQRRHVAVPQRQQRRLRRLDGKVRRLLADLRVGGAHVQHDHLGEPPQPDVGLHLQQQRRARLRRRLAAGRQSHQGRAPGTTSSASTRRSANRPIAPARRRTPAQSTCGSTASNGITRSTVRPAA